MLVLGRGPSLPIAGEAALKLKETSNLHAEAFSSAEVAHGPMTLVGAGDPVLASPRSILPGPAFARDWRISRRGART
jgi:glucosamine--fructose-6-phosphate aminotransferase (isomerizing)